MIIITNPQNSKLEKPGKPGKGSVIRQQTAQSIHHISYEKTAEVKLTFNGDLAIIVGRTTKESTKIKALPIPFSEDKENKLYVWTESSDNLRAALPDNAQSLQGFVGSVRVYTDDGRIYTLHTETEDTPVTVFRTQHKLLLRAGKSMNTIAKEKKSQQLSQMGVWRA